MSDLLLLGLVISAGVIIMPLLLKKIAQMEGKSPEEVKSAEKKTRKAAVKTLKRFAIWAIIIIVLGIVSAVALFLYAIRKVE